MDESGARDGTTTPSYFEKDFGAFDIETMKRELANNSLNLSMGLSNDHNDTDNSDDSDQLNIGKKLQSARMNGIMNQDSLIKSTNGSLIEDSLIKSLTNVNRGDLDASNRVNIDDKTQLIAMQAALIEKDQEVNELNNSVSLLNMQMRNIKMK